MKKPAISPTGHYYAAFPGSFDRRYSAALSVEGTLDTFLRQEDGAHRLVARFENKEGGAAVICGAVRPASAKHPEETAVVGLLNGEVMEVRFLDARRVWTHLLSPRRVTAVAYSPDASLILAGNEVGEVFIFDADTKKPVLAPLRTGSSGVVWLAWLAESRRLVVLTMDHQLSLWESGEWSLVAQHILTTPMATALFLRGSRLFFSSFAKDSGVCWVDLAEVVPSRPLPVWRLTPLHLRVQALRPLSEGVLGVILEDNSVVAVDEATGGQAEWKAGLASPEDAKAMDFFFDSASQEVTFCGQGFLRTLPWCPPAFAPGPGPKLILPEPSAPVKYNLAFASLEDLKTESSEPLLENP